MTGRVGSVRARQRRDCASLRHRRNRPSPPEVAARGAGRDRGRSRSPLVARCARATRRSDGLSCRRPASRRDRCPRCLRSRRYGCHGRQSVSSKPSSSGPQPHGRWSPLPPSALAVRGQTPEDQLQPLLGCKVSAYTIQVKWIAGYSLGGRSNRGRPISSGVGVQPVEVIGAPFCFDVNLHNFYYRTRTFQEHVEAYRRPDMALVDDGGAFPR